MPHPRHSLSLNRVEVVEHKLDEYLRSAPEPERLLAPEEPVRAGTSLRARQAIALFEDQVISRQLDVQARELKKTNQSFYTIASAGHEQNAIVGSLLRVNDPCFLHYRSGALVMARARQARAQTAAFDALLGIVASTDEPIAGGRHKVWGSRELWIPPQTSTIASHLPKAVGTAFALGRGRRVGVGSEYRLPSDTIVLCSFGDASANHATALAGINSARYAHRHGNPTPVLFLCEDNGLGISVETPRHWIADSFEHVRHLHYFCADGELDEIWDRVALAIHTCRSAKAPVFLHLKCHRLWGHAGSDLETSYRPLDQIELVEAHDPLLLNARRLVELGAASPRALAALVADTRERVAAMAREATRRPKLTSLAQVVEPMARYDEAACRAAASATPTPEARRALFGAKLPEEVQTPARRTLAAHINSALADELLRRPNLMIFGEDVGKKGGVYGVTARLQERFGRARVFDTLLDETTILGVAQGAGHVGFLPIPEIQYLAYLHNALDQLRSEACSLAFFSQGQFRNPMVVRIASFAYQRGFGGHFHNDNSITALRDIPGLVLAAPARGDDAARMLRGLLALAQTEGRVACFLEPIALYHERDLHEPGDNGWLTDYAPPGQALLPGDVGLYGAENSDVLIVSYANGLRLSLQAARILEQREGVRARVLDLRWLNPLPIEQVLEQSQGCGAVVIADECRATGGGIASELSARLVEAGFRGRLGSLSAADTYIPLGPAADLVLISRDDIVAKTLEVLR